MVAKLLIFHDSPKEARQEFVELVYACLIVDEIFKVVLCKFTDNN